MNIVSSDTSRLLLVPEPEADMRTRLLAEVFKDGTFARLPSLQSVLPNIGAAVEWGFQRQHQLVGVVDQPLAFRS
jgi:hypothetical protein